MTNDCNIVLNLCVSSIQQNIILMLVGQHTVLARRGVAAIFFCRLILAYLTLMQLPIFLPIRTDHSVR